MGTGPWHNQAVMGTAGLLAALGVLIAIGAVVAYPLLLRVPAVRNHPEAYVGAFVVATALAGLAVARARRRRWPAWLALGFTSLLLVAGTWFNFVGAQVPATPTAVSVGQPPPPLTLPDAAGRPVSLDDYRGKKPVILIFYRGYW
jgi:hypothetical protein